MRGYTSNSDNLQSLEFTLYLTDYLSSYLTLFELTDAVRNMR